VTRSLLASLLCFGPGGGLLAQAAPSDPSAYAITNATIVPVTAARIPRGTIVVQNGRITAVGAAVTIPASAEVIDGTGLFVYPGLIDAGSRLGLTEIGSVPGGVDTREIGDFNPHNLALSAVTPDSELMPGVRGRGIASVVASAPGGGVQGWAAVFGVDGGTPGRRSRRARAAVGGA
jgi:hypothetical protein